MIKRKTQDKRIKEALLNFVQEDDLPSLTDLLSLHPVKQNLLNSLLYDAIDYGHFDIVVYLLENKNLNLDYTYNKNEAFICAATNGHTAIVEYFLTLKNPKVDYTDNNNMAFVTAAYNGHIDVVNLLLKLKNPKVDYTDQHNEAFDYAVLNGHINVINRLLELEDPRIDYNSNNGMAFQFAVSENNITIIDLLLSLPEIDPTTRDFEALNTAIENGNIEIIDMISNWVLNKGTAVQKEKLNEILDEKVATINYEQSTHATSVHKTVSESALRLMAHYGHHIEGYKLSKVLNEVQDYVNYLPTTVSITNMNAAAKRYVRNLLTSDIDNLFLFKDQVSQISVQQVLALTYLAALDTNRIQNNTKEEALAHYVRGLYEVQRGTNINNDKNIDNELDDDTICPEGAFNKAVEVLSGGIHPDCIIEIVTFQQANQKYPKLIQEETFTYLSDQIKKAKTEEQLSDIIELMQSIKQNGIETILENILPSVSKKLIEEFQILYDNPDNVNFQSLLSMAKYVNINEHKLDDHIKKAKAALKEITEGPGYKPLQFSSTLRTTSPSQAPSNIQSSDSIKDEMTNNRLQPR